MRKRENEDRKYKEREREIKKEKKWGAARSDP